MLSNPSNPLKRAYNVRLNAPYGARCFLTFQEGMLGYEFFEGLNAPYGARCFLTPTGRVTPHQEKTGRLNAPYGARCFLRGRQRVTTVVKGQPVLMHLLALGAF